MKYKIFWTRYSEKSLDDILNYIIENDGLKTAYNIYTKIKNKVELLKTSPFHGNEVKELKTVKKYHQIILKPWRIIYSVEKNTINILLVIDGRRDLDEILYEMIINAESN